MIRRAGVLLLVVAVATATLSAAVRLERVSAGRRSADQLLYLPNGKYLKIASLGQAPLLADLVYLWAIQYYADYGRADRQRFVEHVFSDVIAELDPHFVDAYWLGALILITEAGRFDRGMAVLEQGIEANPDNWVLPYLAGWEWALAGRPDRAAEYFAEAEKVAGAPALVARMRAGMLLRAGDLEAALDLWSGILGSPDADDSSRAIAERKVRELTVRIDLRDLTAAVDRFRSENDRNPTSLSELVRRGYIPEVPRHPDGIEYRYDPATGAVSAPGGRVLGDAG